MLRAPALILLFGVLLSSCGRRMSAGRQEDGDTLRLKYSTLLQIVRHEGYTEVSIRNPWRKGSVLHTYLLVPRSAAMPAGLPQGTVVRTPVGRAAVFTTVHCSLLMDLGASGTQTEDRADIPDPNQPNGIWEIIDPRLLEEMPEDVLVHAWFEENAALPARCRRD